MMTPRIALPIDEQLPELVARLRAGSSLLLHAPPGAGKTTRVPPALVAHGVVGSGQLIVLQPRRVAARATARRMAEEHGSPLGTHVGYQIRFERRASAATRILVVTEGILVRRLLEDPFLDGVGGVILDEFHERHLDTDLALAMLRRVQQTVRPDLKLVVMSATLATDRLAAYLGEASILRTQVPTYPVAVEYLSSASEAPLPVTVAAGVRRLAERTTGDLLAFLPGVGEIQRTMRELQTTSPQAGWTLLPLYGDLDPREQDRVFEPATGRKVVLATNVAETSITIPGITGVVDSGWARVLDFEPASGLNRLTLRPISQAAADQRAGRAGRTGPGVALRLWTEASQRARPEFETPELQRIDLSEVVLQLRAWGESPRDDFPWFEAPRPAAIEQADELLRGLGALDDQGVTEIGRGLVRYPVHPRLGRMLVAGAALGELDVVADAVALLSERDPFPRSDRNRTTRHVSRSDLWDRLDHLREHRRTGREEFELGTIHREGARRIERVAEQLRSLTPHTREAKRGEQGTAEVTLARAVLAGFPDRVARRRRPGAPEALLATGRGVQLSEASGVREAEYFVALEVDGAREPALVRIASAIDRAWLTGPGLHTRTMVEFDAATGRVQARQRTTWGALVLTDAPAPLPESHEVAAVLAAAARQAWDRVYPPDDPAVPRWIARVESLRSWFPELELPDFSETVLQTRLERLSRGCRSLTELRQASWIDVLREELSPSQRAALERETPERIQVPSGSRIAIEYTAGGPPVLPVRIQEVFGWQTTPRIASGRVKLVLHLLAPNHRPQQITDDLASFWANGYPIVRGELRRRYPKHAWPDDPRSAAPERRPTRK